jgi:hypothetical protein
MTTRLVVIFLFLVNNGFSQNKSKPTQFDRFVQKPKIEWAAYASDTFNFPLLNRILYERLQKNKIKASLPFDSRTADADKVSYVTLDSIDKIFFDEGEPAAIDSGTFTNTEVTQVLFIENGCLKSYIPWVTPTLPVYISTGTYIGQRFYFNSAYNYRYNYRPKKRNRLSYLGQTKKMVKLDDPATELKKMNGRNMLQVLWTYIQTNEIAVFTAEGEQKIDLHSKSPDISNMQAMPVPTWDSGGMINKWVVTYDGYGSGSYTDAQLLQDWYYDHKENTVISCVRELLLYATKDNKGTVPAFKMVFK